MSKEQQYLAELHRMRIDNGKLKEQCRGLAERVAELEEELERERGAAWKLRDKVSNLQLRLHAHGGDAKYPFPTGD